MDELQARRQKLEETEKAIMQAREARLKRQFDMYRAMKARDEILLGEDVIETGEEETYNVKIDENGEIEVDEKEE